MWGGLSPHRLLGDGGDGGYHPRSAGCCAGTGGRGGTHRGVTGETRAGPSESPGTKSCPVQ